MQSYGKHQSSRITCPGCTFCRRTIHCRYVGWNTVPRCRCIRSTQWKTNYLPDLISCLTISSSRWRWRSHSRRCWNTLFIDVAWMTRYSRRWCLCRMLLWGCYWCGTVCWSGCKHSEVRLKVVAGPDRSAGSVMLSQVFDRWFSQRCLVLRSCVDLPSSCYALDAVGWSLYPSVVVGSGTWRLIEDDVRTRQYLHFPRPSASVTSSDLRSVGRSASYVRGLTSSPAAVVSTVLFPAELEVRRQRWWRRGPSWPGCRKFLCRGVGVLPAVFHDARRMICTFFNSRFIVSFKSMLMRNRFYNRWW